MKKTKAYILKTSIPLSNGEFKVKVYYDYALDGKNKIIKIKRVKGLDKNRTYHCGQNVLAAFRDEILEKKALTRGLKNHIRLKKESLL